MADGGAGNSQRNESRANLSALALNSSQQQDRRRADDDSYMSDSSVGAGADESRESVLAHGAAQQSYTSGQTEEVEGPLAGGGLMVSQGMEFDRMRQQAQQMQRTQTQFLGTAGEAPGPATGAPAQRMTGSVPGQAAGATEEEEESEEDMAQDLQQQQQSLRQNLQNRAKNEVKKKAKQQLEKQAERLAKKGVQQGTRFTLEAVEVAGSEILVPLLILFLQMNIQLVMKYVFRPLISGTSEDIDNALEGAPFFDQSLPEDVAIVAIDGLMCCSAPCTNPACAPFTFLIIIIIIIFKLLGKS